MRFLIRRRFLINLTIFTTLMMTRTLISKPLFITSITHEKRDGILASIMNSFGSSSHQNRVISSHKSLRNDDNNNECRRYKIISARGTGEPQKNPYGYSQFISSVLEAVPDGSDYEVEYPATVDYLSGPGQGATNAINFITAQKKSCSEQLYILIGYSEGAMVMTKLLAKSQLPAKNIVAVILYGNPYFKGNQPQNSCEAKSGAGIAAFTGISLPSKFSSITFDCCKIGDMICQTLGNLIPHLAYSGSEDEKAAIEFAVEKLKVAIEAVNSSTPDDVTSDDVKSNATKSLAIDRKINNWLKKV